MPYSRNQVVGNGDDVELRKIERDKKSPRFRKRSADASTLEVTVEKEI